MIDNQKWQAMIFAALLLCFSACGTDYDSDSDNAPIPAPASRVTTPRPAIQGFPFGTDSAHPALRNKAGDMGPTRDTGMTVLSGDRIEVRPSCLLREQRKGLIPVVSRTDHNVCTQSADVCVATVPVFQRRCDNQCNVCIKCSLFGCFPWQCCNSVCRDVHVSDRCVATERRCTQQQDQWIETSTFSGLDASQPIKDTAPMKSSDLLLAGLKLRFSFLDANGSQQNVDCGLAQFKPDTDSEKFSFLLRNVDGCPSIFSDGAKTSPTLSLVNGMAAPIPYSQGRLVKTWDGRVLEKPQDSTYLPNIDFLGTLSVYSGPASN